MENENELNNTMKELIKELKIFNMGFKLIFANALVKSKLIETFNKTKVNNEKSKTKNFSEQVYASDEFKFELKRVANDVS